MADAWKICSRQGDPDDIKEGIQRLKEQGYVIKRLTRYHLKIGPVNYYLPKGRITIDPQERYDVRGVSALVELLETRFPHQARVKICKNASGDGVRETGENLDKRLFAPDPFPSDRAYREL